MAPRRGGSSYSSSSFDSSAWSQTTILSLDYGYNGYGPNKSNYRTLFLTRFAFDILSLLVLIGFIIWSCTIRNRGLPLKGVIYALLSFILSQICIITWEALYVASAEVTMYYLITLMLTSFFNFLGICLTFYVFWSLIHRMLGRLTDSGKPYAAVTIVHWILQGLIAVLSLADWALYVAYLAGTVTNYSTKLGQEWIRLESALYIIYFVLSIEVLAWSIFVVVKAGNHRFVSKMPAISLISGAIGWFAISLTWAVMYIRYNLESKVSPNYLYTAQAIVQFIFWIVTFVGILLCCSKWSKLGEEPEKLAAPAQYPYPQYPPAQYPPGQYPQGQYPPGQYQAPYPAPYPQGQYPPTQQQPYGTAPYQAYSAQQPQGQQPQTQQREAPSPQ